MAHKSRILIIDDTEQIRASLRRVLRRAGHEVDTASGGKEGLDKITADRPDLVLLDLMMPGMDGFAVLDALRARHPSNDVKVLVISATAQQEARLRALTRGALDYIEKTAPVEEVLARVSNMLALKTAREALLGGYAMMRRCLEATDALLAGPLDAIGDQAERSGNGLAIHRDLNRARNLLGQFKEYLGLNLSPRGSDEITPRALVEDALMSHPGTLRMAKQGVEFGSGIDDAAIQGARVELCRVVEILIGNAAVHALVGTETRISVRRDEAFVHIAVANRHPGIPDHEIPRLFTPFPSAKDARERGFGLDLAIASIIARKHGGDVACSSVPDGETVFTLSLPLSKGSRDLRQSA